MPIADIKSSVVWLEQVQHKSLVALVAHGPEAGFLNFFLELFSNFEKCIFLPSLETCTDKHGSKVGK